ncbi:LOW QUALITY PROTEIN: hypothetical protein ACHAW6_004025, partial [Cyclotella cf. meneghiniana]
VELDSHTDTCIVGRHALIIHEHPKVVWLPVDPLQPAQKATVVDVAIKYTRCNTGDPMILLINQAILVPEVDHCLLPMQCRINGIEINEVPRFLTSNQSTSSHSIVISDPMDDAHQHTILLQLEGVVSYFEYTLPISAEYEDEDIPHLELMAESPAWELRMPCNLLSNTLFCRKVPSVHGYTMIFATDFGWSQSYPMSCKSQAHDALGLLFAWERVSPKMIVDGTKEMRLGEFARKCKEATCYLRGTEPYSAWSNSAEREIRELKKDAARKLTRSGVPRWLWCFVLEYESYVCSHTSHDIYQLDGHIPKMVVSGETADISPFCIFGFWD